MEWSLPINSYAARISVFPTRHWLTQVSAGRIAKPEGKSLGDVIRSTASLQYSRAGLSASLIWGRNHDTFSHRNLNSYLAEAVLPSRAKNFLTGRWEWVDKDELFRSGAVYRIGEYIAGDARDIATIDNIAAGISANVTLYSLPAAIEPAYGEHPWAISTHLRFRLK